MELLLESKVVKSRSRNEGKKESRWQVTPQACSLSNFFSIIGLLKKTVYSLWSSQLFSGLGLEKT